MQQKNFLWGPCRMKGKSVGLCIPLSLLSDNWVYCKDVCAATKNCWTRFLYGRVVSEESRSLILPGTTCSIFFRLKNAAHSGVHADTDGLERGLSGVIPIHVGQMALYQPIFRPTMTRCRSA